VRQLKPKTRTVVFTTLWLALLAAALISSLSPAMCKAQVSCEYGTPILEPATGTGRILIPLLEAGH
jgi:hypothetical protein